MIASNTKTGLGNILVSSLNKMAWNKNQRSGKMPKDITRIPILNNLFSLIFDPLKCL